MSQKLIVFGGVYRNHGKGTTCRTVESMRDGMVWYCQLLRVGCRREKVSLASFAKWAGSRVDESPASDLDGPKGAAQ